MTSIVMCLNTWTIGSCWVPFWPWFEPGSGFENCLSHFCTGVTQHYWFKPVFAKLLLRITLLALSVTPYPLSPFPSPYVISPHQKSPPPSSTLYKQKTDTIKLVPALTRLPVWCVCFGPPTLTILHSPWRAGREPDTWAQQAPGMQLLGITGVPFLGIQDLGLEICARPCVLRDQQDGFPLHRTAPEHTANFPAGPRLTARLPSEFNHFVPNDRASMFCRVCIHIHTTFSLTHHHSE